MQRVRKQWCPVCAVAGRARAKSAEAVASARTDASGPFAKSAEAQSYARSAGRMHTTCVECDAVAAVRTVERGAYARAIKGAVKRCCGQTGLVHCALSHYATVGLHMLRSLRLVPCALCLVASTL